MQSKKISLAIGTLTVLAAGPLSAALSINLVPDAGTPQSVINGFTAAAALWSSKLTNNVTVNIEIGYSSLGSGVIGSTNWTYDEFGYTATKSALASSRTSTADYSSYGALPTGSSYSRLINHTSDDPYGKNSATSYLDTTMSYVGMTSANAKVLGLAAPSSALDASIVFNSDSSISSKFGFNHSNVTSGQIDFVGVAEHEIGHALGFVSAVDDLDGYGGAYPGFNIPSDLLDLYRFSAASITHGTGVTDLSDNSQTKYFSVNGGLTSVAQFSDGTYYGDGYQASHWKNGLSIGLMDPNTTLGKTMNLSAADLQAFDVLGYNLSSVPEPNNVLALSGLVAGALFMRTRRRARVYTDCQKFLRK